MVLHTLSHKIKIFNVTKWVCLQQLRTNPLPTKGVLYMNISINNNCINALSTGGSSLNPHISEGISNLSEIALNSAEPAVIYSGERILSQMNAGSYEFDITSVAYESKAETEEDVLDNMISKYNTFKDSIYKKYSGETLESQLKELDEGFYNAVENFFEASFTEISKPFYQQCCNLEDTSQSEILEDMASKYEKLRNVVSEKLSDKDLNKILTRLDNSYDNISEKYIVGGIDKMTQNKISQTIIDIKISKIINSINEGLGDNSPFKNHKISTSYINCNTRAYNTVAQKRLSLIKDSLRNLIKKSKKYIMEGNNAPTTEEEKELFSNYISADSDGTYKNLSYSDIKSLSSQIDNVFGSCLVDTVSKTFGNLSNSEIQELYPNADNIMNSLANEKISEYNETESTSYSLNDDSNNTINSMEKELYSLLEKKLENLNERKKNSESTTSQEEYEKYIKYTRLNKALDERMTEIVGNYEILKEVLGEQFQ